MLDKKKFDEFLIHQTFFVFSLAFFAK